VDYLHSHNIVHRDIKLENIMVKKEKGNIKDTFIVKLIDFGFAL
jgi:serine/threonine protein kinase